MASKGKKKPSLFTLSRQPLLTEEEREAYWNGLVSESDRSVAIRASAFVEHDLFELLVSAMRNDIGEKEIEDLFFRAGAILANFSQRIEIARGMGLIDNDQKNDLNAIRHIRNTFAHAVTHIDFNTPLISAECDKIRNLIPSQKGSTRQIYIYATHEIGIDLLRKSTDIKVARTRETIR